MVGQVFINGKDAFKTWGVTFQRSSLSNFIQRGNQKDVTENKSRSIDGKLVSIKNPRQDSRTFTADISINAVSITDLLTKQDAFFSELAGGVVYLNIPFLAMTFKLVYKKNQMRISDHTDTFASFKITFEEPNPNDRI